MNLLKTAELKNQKDLKLNPSHLHTKLYISMKAFTGRIYLSFNSRILASDKSVI